MNNMSEFIIILHEVTYRDFFFQVEKHVITTIYDVFLTYALILSSSVILGQVLYVFPF